MNIVTALNKEYVRYTIVMLTSLCYNNHNERIVAYLLNDELDESDQELFKTSLARFDIEIIPLCVDRSYFSDRIRTTDMWSIEAYYRLMLPDILPSDVDRLIYLDVDIIVNKSISKFYNMNFGDLEIIATQDSNGRIPWDDMGSVRKKMFEPMIKKGYRYINSGVMLMNMSLIREKYSFMDYVDAMEEWDYEMVAPDQDIINYVHWEKIGYVDADYYDLMVGFAHAEGMTYEDAVENVAVLHYSGQKPWHNKYFHFPIQQIWWDYAKMTPFYHELLEEFEQSAMFDPTVEEIMTEYANNSNETETLRAKLGESLELNKKLVAMIESIKEGNV